MSPRRSIDSTGHDFGMTDNSCDHCRRRTWLLAKLAGYIDNRRVSADALNVLLDLTDEELIAAVAPRDRQQLVSEWDSWKPAQREDQTTQSVCRHSPHYPARLKPLPAAPAELSVLGGLERLQQLVDGPVVSIVGSRRCSWYGREVAAKLSAEIAATGITVMSGMAFGVDCAAHEGALSVSQRTIAVLAANPAVAYPRSKRQIHHEIATTGVVLAELPAGVGVRRWMFPARNRIIAGLSDLTIVIEAAARSGSLITAWFAREYGREVAAVPGQISSPLAAGTNALIKDGAHLINDAKDVLDIVYGVSNWHSNEPQRRQVPEHLETLYRQICSKPRTHSELIEDSTSPSLLNQALAELELLGIVNNDCGQYHAVL